MGRLKTAVLINHSAELGGAEFALKRLVGMLDRREWNPVVIFGEEGAAVECIRKMSIETYVLPAGKILQNTRKDALTGTGICSIRRCINALSYIRKLARFLQECAADVVHTNSMKAHVLGGLAAKLAGIPVVWHIRDTVDPSYMPTAAVRLMRWLVQRVPNRVITVSHSVARSLLGECAGTKARVVYDGLDDSAFEACAVPKASPQWKVGMIGRLCPWKGQHVFIEAAALLHAKGLLVDFEILGSPMFGEKKYADGLLRQVDVLGLARCVHFKGFVSDVTRRLRSWDVCVHASTSPDPCPNVILEAMAAGVPVIGSAGGGVPELLDGGRCGELYPMGDSKELAVALERLLLDRKRRNEYATLARERASSIFRAERVAKEVEEVWHSVVQDRTWPRRRWRWIEEGLGVGDGAVWTSGCVCQGGIAHS
ncbi:MAG: glycosyltransferase family 4 protein [Verrucomicrobiota bacterium]